MTTLSIELNRYLTIRRSLGHSLRTSEGMLKRFAAFLDRRGAELITTDSFLQWKVSYGSATRNTWAARLSMVRLFAQWMHAIDPRHEVPAK